MNRILELLESYFEENDRAYDNFSPRVKEELDMVMKLKRNSAITRLQRCTSPIEQLIGLHMDDLVDALKGNLSMISLDGESYFYSQEPVRVGSQTFRTDFSVYCFTKGQKYKFAIECDGHRFHEKTKEQARHDRGRERKLMAAGYTIIRFTGSEIWENPARCVNQIREIIEKHLGVHEALMEMEKQHVKLGD